MISGWLTYQGRPVFYEGQRIVFNNPPTSPIIIPRRLYTAQRRGMYYDASILSSMSQSRTAWVPAEVDAPVGQIRDLSGDASNNRHLIAVSDAARPILRMTPGGHYYLEGNGINTEMRTATFATPLVQPIQVMIAARAANAGQIFDPLSANAFQASHLANGTFRFSAGTALTTVTQVVTQGTDFVMDIRADGANSGISIDQLNSGNYLVGNAGTGGMNGLTLFANRTPSIWFSGRFYAGMWITGAFSADERARMKTWAASKQGRVL